MDDRNKTTLDLAGTINARGGKGRPGRVEVREPVGSVDASDIYGLLAAITMIEARDRPCRSSIEPSPRIKPVAKMLDSLAALLVSKPKHEVLSTALRVHRTRVEVMVADDGDVSESATAHLAWIWRSLRQISSRYRMLLRRAKGETTGWRLMDEDEILRSKVSELRRGCTKFSFAVVQKRVNKRFREFQENFEEFKSKERHPFLPVLNSILMLEALFTREEGARYGKPANEDTETWTLFVALLREATMSFYFFFLDGGFTPDELDRVGRFAKWESYLYKIGSILDNVDVLLYTATASKYRSLFRLEFSSTVLPKMTAKAPSVPEGVSDWEKVFVKALSQYNSGKKLAWERKMMVASTISKDAIYMAESTISKDLVVHCEVKLLSHIAATEFQSPSPDKPEAFSYIGSSKPACRGCYAFIQAFNEVHNTHFLTKKTTGKSYWPWQLPQDFPRSQETAVSMYKILSKYWADSYRGYMREGLPSPYGDEAFKLLHPVDISMSKRFSSEREFLGL